jgi:hypothetical protein
MEITTYEKDNKLYYVLRKYDEFLEKTFVHNGYTKYAK